MPHIAYLEKNFRRDSLDIIAMANEIAADYRRQGYDLTLRQLYYQFVARGHLGNSDKNYKRLGGIVNDARLAGLLDWSYIVDRTRNISGLPGGWEEPSDIIRQSARVWGRDLWEASDQEYRPEVWVEKEALAGVVGHAAGRLNVPYFSCRGYVSQSEMWAAGRRMQRYMAEGLTPVVIHLGDHDPSGLDMTRDIRERLDLFAEAPIDVQRIALNWDQIEQYSPPPNPAKLTDSRGSRYVEEYGYESWELDALDPSTLDALITDALEPFIDTEAWEREDAADQEVRDRMSTIADRWDAIGDRWADIETLLDEDA